MDKIIQALEMAQTELTACYKKLKVDRSNVLTDVEDALIEAKDWKKILDEYKTDTNHTIEVPISDNATITTSGVVPKIHLT